ncbi:Xaa-Pro peptidase family protein [Telmatospirillum sp. J64-1]|uniref:M24 family metallopeptidase n=1 Tax=Telmatospirillum sp. J64-1 TaxID=2502183 RepID=UPI00115DB9FC|nr:Xaa-Pro peptidase family protein [Telmatospirillum sp. J64-1]
MTLSHLSENDLAPALTRFSDAERDRRWRQIRWRMDLAGLDALLVWGNESKWQAGLANNRYISGRVAPGCLLFPLDGDPVIWSGFPHDVTPWGALAGGWIGDVRAGQQTTQDIVKTLKDRGYQNAAIGIVGFGETRPRVIPEVVPYQQFSTIRDHLPNARFVEAGWLLEQTRMIKGEEEIAMLRRSAELANAMAQAMVETARPGVREYEVFANMLHASLSAGGEEEMIWMSSGAFPPPHGKRPPATDRRLEAGDIVICEYHARFEGYLTGAEVSVSLGEPRKEFAEIHRVCVESQKAGIAGMQLGRPFSDAVLGFRKPIIDAGFGSVECGLHGHGLASPEFPSTMYGGSAGAWEEHAYARIPTLEFQENMVFATASDVYNPNWKKDTGLMLGRTILITKDGPEELTGLPLSPEMIVV